MLAWLLIPVVLVSYHFGPGQAALAYRKAQASLADAKILERDGHFDEAIERYGETLAALPQSDEPPPALALRRDQLRLAQIQARFQLGRLAETLESLNLLIDDVEREHGPNSPLAQDARVLLGRVHYQAMVRYGWSRRKKRFGRSIGSFRGRTFVFLPNTPKATATNRCSAATRNSNQQPPTPPRRI
ncbi:MAG: hypothetical protein SGI77_17280 [Pirellulaceae bacterium]|nr:hypothetical protein [Pirellulaceae bacterium]